VKKSRPRHVAYDPEIATSILARIAAGEALTRICKSPGMPPVVAVYEWARDNPEFASAYARARDDRADTLADQITDIADDESIPPDSRGVRVDARKWVAAKLLPKRYGDKVTQEHTGADGGPMQFAEVRRTLVDPKPEG